MVGPRLHHRVSCTQIMTLGGAVKVEAQFLDTMLSGDVRKSTLPLVRIFVPYWFMPSCSGHPDH